MENLPPVEWLIENEIPRRSLTVLYGPSGAGKSFVASGYALRLAQSEPVVYIAAEGASGYASRLQAWCAFKKQTPGPLYFWLGAVQLLNALVVTDFLRKIAAVQPALVIIDTLARCMIGGDENSAKDMGLFVEACAKIQKTGSAVMVIHHTGKGSNGPRGSSALYGAADSIIQLSNDGGLIQVRCEKLKDGKPFEPRYLRLIEKEVTELRRLLTEVACKQAWPQYLTVEQLAEVLHISPRTVHDMVSARRIPFHKAGSQTRFLIGEIVEWTAGKWSKERQPAQPKRKSRPARRRADKGQGDNAALRVV